jgi:sugar phosphate isomerase/epimerase
MTQPLAVQLYTVREELARDFEGTIRKIAAMGYAGVEAHTFPEGVTPSSAKALFDELGLAVCAVHAPLPLGETKTSTFDVMAALDCDRLVCAYLPPEEYADLTLIDRTIKKLNEAAASAAENDLRLGVHNHWWEFQLVEGVRPYQLWLQKLDPTVFYELDLYWAKVAGVDPTAVLAEFGEKGELVHVKDGPADGHTSSMTACGQGSLDYTEILPAAKAAEWLIVELDRCDTDMMTAVQESYTYLTSKGLAHGTR